MVKRGNETMIILRTLTQSTNTYTIEPGDSKPEDSKLLQLVNFLPLTKLANHNKRKTIRLFLFESDNVVLFALKITIRVYLFLSNI